MPYVTSDGKLVEGRPWGVGRIVDMFWGAVQFVSLFFQSLVGLDNRRGSSGSRSGNGSGRREIRTGNPTTFQDCSMPGGG